MKKLLNIDGGGVKIYFSLLILKYIENKTNKKIIDLFDFFAGVSSSSIVLSGLLISYTIDEVIINIKNLSKNIFYRSTFYTLRSGFGLLQPKYPDIYIDKELINYSKNYKLKEIEKPLIILSYDLISNKPIYFKSYDIDNDYLVWQIIRGSISVPYYFVPYELDNKLLIDGGIVVNNLTELIITNAINYFGELETYFQLSIGCGYKLNKLKNIPSGLLSWSNLLLDTISKASSEYQLDNITNLKNIENIKYFYRLDVELDEVIELDNCYAFDKIDIIFSKWLKENNSQLDIICNELINI
jgi:hypothetical protein